MPSTLSIIRNVFTDARKRTTAVGIAGGVGAIGVIDLVLFVRRQARLRAPRRLPARLAGEVTGAARHAFRSRPAALPPGHRQPLNVPVVW
jgi:hypothetical protein